MKKKFIFITIIILLLDQISKIYIKTHFKLGDKYYISKYIELFFLENPGIAYGFDIGIGHLGKILLSLIRLLLIIYIIFIIKKNIKNINYDYFIFSISLIFAGAIGNLIDSIFYGIIFDTGTVYNNSINKWIGYNNISNISIINNCYSNLMEGCVVDFLSFPFMDKYILPKWIPYIGNFHLEYFKPIFNISDISIFLGTFLFIFNKKIKY